MDIISYYVNIEQKWVILNDSGEILPITNFFYDGEELFDVTEYDEVTSFVCGPDSDGKWHTIDVTQFRWLPPT